MIDSAKTSNQPEKRFKVKGGGITSKKKEKKRLDVGVMEPLFQTNNDKMKQFYEQIERVSTTQAPVLITGESGTGKEIVAKRIHKLSSCEDNSFVAVNCGALPTEIVESQLFGHEKGAFTGAVKQKHGYFELADKGTLFLDEVAEMSPNIQVKLLRALETGTIRRVGGESTIDVDVRIIAATNKQMDEALQNGTFREDLYYRLGVMQFRIPSLRERIEDIPLFTEYFVRKFSNIHGKEISGYSDKFIEMLKNYRWPGNIRELKNVLERCVVMCDGKNLSTEHLPAEISELTGYQCCRENNHQYIKIPVGSTIQEAERALIKESLQANNHNISNTAKVLGYCRATLYKKIEEYDLHGNGQA